MAVKARIIIKNGVWSKIDRLDSRVASRIYKAMRFMSQKNFWAAGGRNRTSGWKGYVDFYDKGNGSFLTGLVPEMELLLRDMGVPYEMCRLKDCPTPVELREDLLCPTIVRPRGQQLRDDQVEYLWRMIEHRRGIVKAATGYGKTAVMAAYLKMVPEDIFTVIVINSKDLISQTIEGFEEYGIDPDRLGWIFNSKTRGRRVIISTTPGLQKLDDVGLLPHVQVLMVDEAHHGSTTNKMTRWMKKMTNCMDRFAFSATPFKPDKVHNMKLRGHFGIQLGDVPLHELQDIDVLTTTECHFYYVDHPDADYEAPFQEAYQEYLVNFNEYNDFVAKKVRALKGRTLVSVEWKDQGEALAARIPGAHWVSADNPKKYRDQLRGLLRNDPDDIVVIATKVFGTGLDFYIHNLVNAGGGKSEIKVKQLFGRGVRKSGDKQHLLYIDFVHIMNKHLKRHSNARVKHLKDEFQEVTIHEDGGLEF